jgi:hypothetical protein
VAENWPGDGGAKWSLALGFPNLFCERGFSSSSVDVVVGNRLAISPLALTKRRGTISLPDDYRQEEMGMDAQKWRDFVSHEVLKAGNWDDRAMTLAVILGEIAAQLMELNQNFAWPEPEPGSKLTRLKP